MSRLKKADIEKIKTLEQAVISGTCDEVSQLFRDLGEIRFTAHILGLACRFRGTDMVKTLVENGASFEYDAEAVKYKFFELFGNYYPGESPDFMWILFRSSLLSYDRTLSWYVNCLTDKNKKLHVVDDKELIKTVKYLCENAKKASFNTGDFLYYMILTDETEMVNAMKSAGVTLSEKKKKLLTEGDKDNSNGWYLYCALTNELNAANFKRAISELVSEVGSGKKLHFTEYFGNMNNEKLFSAEIFGFFLDHFNQAKMNKTKLLKEIIGRENVCCLETAVQNGWLKTPKKRDEMIQYATDTQKTECAAFLLDFKNRTADFEAERQKAEKKLMSELNADPNSTTELKKNWRFKKKDDNTLIITGYKGKNTVLVVPEKIDGDTVTEIERWALSTSAPRIKEPTRKFRETITRIILPKSIRIIGDSAFRGLVSLEEIVIPKGVEFIGECALSDCIRLTSVVIPEGVTVLDDNVFTCYHGASNLESVVLPRTLKIFRDAHSAQFGPALFHNCPKLTVQIPPSKYAKMYCETHKLNFKYMENENEHKTS